MNNPNIYVLTNQLLLIKSLLDWRRAPEKSLRVIYRQNYLQAYPTDTGHSSKELLNAAIESTISNLTMQSFTAEYEFLRKNITETMSKDLKDIRNRLSTTATNLNTTKLLDTIRQSFAHNDINMPTPNWKYTQDFKIEINLKNNHLLFEVDDLRNLMNEFLLLKQNHFLKSFQISIDKLTYAANHNKLKPDNINKFITEVRQDGTHELFDKYQSNALYNLIINDYDINFPRNRVDEVLDNNSFIISQLMPLKHNGGLQSFRNNLTVRMLYTLQNAVINREVFEITASNMEKNYKLIDWYSSDRLNGRLSMINFMLTDSDLFEVTLISNVLFNIFSLIPANQIFNHFNLSADFNRIRNSVIHGRYFYNFNHGFEFYDGRTNDNLEHIGTLELPDIIDFAFSFLESYVEDYSI